jgi:hypothetical protein
MLMAQQAATGARTCMASAVRTIGRKFRNRRRIDPFHPVPIIT